jgi:hypothetical protein
MRVPIASVVLALLLVLALVSIAAAGTFDAVGIGHRW